jgi:Flp pilus assembly protein TadG
MSVELVLLTIPLVAILLFVAAVGRFSDARNQIDEAASDAARNASTYLVPTLADQAGTQIALQDLSGVCADSSVVIDTSQLHPGGQVTATVICQVSLADLVLLKLPGDRTVTASSTAVVDTYVPAAATATP